MIFTYNGYYTKLTYDTETHTFHGKIENIQNEINFHANTIEEFKKIFEKTVDSIQEQPTIPSPHILKDNIVWYNHDFEKIVGYDTEKEMVILRKSVEPWTTYNGISITTFLQIAENNLDKLLKEIETKLIDVDEMLELSEKIEESGFGVYLSRYKEIWKQLNYYARLKETNSRLYHIYQDAERQFLKGERRKEKLAHRYLDKETVEKMRECMREEKILSKRYYLIRKKNLELKKEELKKHGN